MKRLKIGGSDAGFFSMMRGTVGTFLRADQLGEPYVSWDRTLYNEAEYGPNAWEYYFEQFPEINPEDEVSGCHHVILPREYQTRVAMNHLLNKYVVVKQHVWDIVDPLVIRLGEKPLGVHIRLTDKNNCTVHGEPETGKPVTLNNYMSHINNYLEENPDSKIFLATDDYDCLATIRDRYEDKVVFSDSIRSSGDVSIHHGSSQNGYTKGLNVLVDALTLSSCHHIIKGISNVALFALFWNLELTSENMNSIYNGDTREDFVNVR